MTNQVQILTSIESVISKCGTVKPNPFFNTSLEYIKENKQKARAIYPKVLKSYILANVLVQARREGLVESTSYSLLSDFNTIQSSLDRGWSPKINLTKDMLKLKV
uniref:Uncharacterized protein n=1 Tax=viral metagenome TaxID=1070528 RepID=A0A6M3JV40_9ZZZZ